MRRVVALLLFAAVITPASLWASAGSVHAAFPGSNGKIAFDRGRIPQLFTMDPDGTNLVQITSGSGDPENWRASSRPAWSPDGTKIAFIRSRPAGTSIRTVDADGANEIVVVGIHALPTFHMNDVAWSPDASQLAFCAYNELGRTKVFVVDVDGTGLTKLSHRGELDCAPAWSNDGTQIVVRSRASEGNGDLVLLAPDGSTREVIFREGSSGSPNWAPDDSLIVFVWKLLNDIVVLSLDGTVFDRVTDSPRRREFHPVFSPDGTAIAFSQAATGTRRDLNDIWTIGVDGTNPVRLTDTPLRDELHPDWQPV